MRGIPAICLLLVGASQAANVYLTPSEALPSRLSPKSASLVISRHLGLEQFEAIGLGDSGENYAALLGERDFIGEGTKNALFLVVDEAYSEDIIPPTMQPAFSISGSPAPSSLSSLVSTYLQRARHAYSLVYSDLSVPSKGLPRVLDIFSAPTPANEAFLSEVLALTEFLEVISDDKFAAVELNGLTQLAAAYGRSSEQYITATHTIRALIETGAADTRNRIAVLALPLMSVTQSKRQPPQQSPLPIPDTPDSPPERRVSTCLTTASACANATNTCSGRGECVSTLKAGQECFVCSCSTTKNSNGQTENWAGAMCERKDVSGPFVLIAGTVIALILLMGASVSLLYSIGSYQLPSILTGGVAGGVRKDQ
ncbi:hypothetical protein BV22DRAFT_1067197 [Leucogyrophana mollusca]|uniref:Uncharacterized protein n=1 Tax=Leucogyrophana mollusca TaxID=85980 RepID=A0ACB8BFB7_9AGAM|nr:hypothetical protein BV22DRAFT_1067197 [Leucogyrophana mollusca]